jgi:negative regulator of genetic competence, sporulation and motility
MEKKREEWSNWNVGEGYQAKGVIRQKNASSSNKIVDMTVAPASFEGSNKDSDDEKRKQAESRSASDRDHGKKDKKEKKEKKDKKPSSKEKKRKRDKDDEGSRKSTKSCFNPLLQFFATRLSDTTLSFQKNEFPL